jgi:dienelactone hydrolase
MGVREQLDVRATLDWLEATKGPERIGILGNSMGAATGLLAASNDARIDAVLLDSVHGRLEDNLAERMPMNGHPSYPGTWAILIGGWIRSGVNLNDADPMSAIAGYGDRPLRFLHGTADREDLPARAEDLLAAALAAGVPADFIWCAGAGHGHVVDDCADRYPGWTRDFFTAALGGEAG